MVRAVIAATVLISPLVASVAPAGAVSDGAGAPVFDQPSGLAFADGMLWVTDEADSSVTEIDPSSGAVVSDLTGSTYGFDEPTAIAADGPDLFVANGSGTVSEIQAGTGEPVRVISGARYGLDDPVALIAAPDALLVLSAGQPGSHPPVDGSLTAIDPSDRRLVARISSPSFVDPTAMAVAGSDVFVADKGDDSVTDVSLSTGAIMAVITRGGLHGPDGIAAVGQKVWVADSATAAATEIDAADDQVVTTVKGPAYGFWLPSVAVASGDHVFIATPFGTSPMVTKMSATTGAPAWFMCNTNGPYYFSDLSALAVSGQDLWVASSTGANNPRQSARTGSLTELSTTTGALIATYPAR